MFGLVYDELRDLADWLVRQEGARDAPAATSLVHQAYEKLAGRTIESASWEHHNAFLGAAAQAMRRILIDRARARSAHKRGGGAQRWPLSAVASTLLGEFDSNDPAEDLLAVERSLAKLAESESQAADVVSCRFYAGLTIEQTAAALGISEATVKREWRFARAWLYARLRSGADDD